MTTKTFVRLDATRAVDLARWVLECGIDRDVLLGDFPPVFTAHITKPGLDAFQQHIRDVQRLMATPDLVNYDGHPYLTWLAIALRQAQAVGCPRSAELETVFEEVLAQARRQAEGASRSLSSDEARLGRTTARFAAPTSRPDAIFLSYRSADRGAVHSLYDRLVASIGEDRVFLDAETIRPGEKWLERLRGGLLRARVVATWITGAYLTSQWGAFEVGVAQERGATIVPVFAEAGVSVPAFISEHQGLKLHESSLDDVANALVEALDGPG